MARSGTPSRRAEVVVVGGGLAGVCAAYFLARTGLEPLLLEARTLASGATGAGTGMVTLGLGEPYERTVARAGRARARAIWRFTAENHRRVAGLVRVLDRSCGYARTGGLRAALDAGEAEALARSLPLLRRDGFPVEPYRGPLPGNLVAALWVRDEGLIDPVAFTRRLAEVAEERGAIVAEGAPVRRLRADRRALRLSTPRGEVRCEWAIVAAGISTGALVPPLRGVFRPLKNRVQSARLDGPVPPPGICRSGGYYWRPLSPGRLAVGGPDRHRLRLFLRRTFPRARISGPGRAGLVDWVADGHPVVGPVRGAPRVLACAGFCGTGFGYATLAAGMCADIVAGRGNRILRWMAAKRW